MTATSEATAPTAPAALNLDQLLGKTAPEKDYLVCLDGAARTAMIAAEEALTEANRRLERERDAIAARHGERLGPPPQPGAKLLTDVSEAEQRLKEAEDNARLHTIALHLRGIGRHDYEELLSQFPATEKQIQKAKSEGATAGLENPILPTIDPDEFQPALVAACVTNMKMTIEQAKQLRDSPGWNSRDWFDLYSGCLDVCAIGGHVDLGKGSSTTRSSERSSTTASKLPASPTLST